MTDCTVYYTRLDGGRYLAASCAPCFSVSADSEEAVKAKVSEILTFHEERLEKEPAVPEAWVARATKTVRPFAPIKIEHRRAGVVSVAA